MKVYNIVENIATTGEIAHDEQFLPLPQCFQKSSAADASKCICSRVKKVPSTQINQTFL